jgi:hypothetical protein
MKHTRREYDLSVTLMLAAVAGAIAQVIGTLLDTGRAFRWWP